MTCDRPYFGDEDWFATCDLEPGHASRVHQGDAFTTIRVEGEIAPGSGIRFTSQQHATFTTERVELGRKYWTEESEVEAP